MKLLNETEVFGDIINLRRTDWRHNFGGKDSSRPLPTGDAVSFNQVLLEAMNSTNDQQHLAERVSEAYQTNPESVDTHDVTIAMAEARLTLQLAKSISDAAIQAYRDIINTR